MKILLILALAACSSVSTTTGEPQSAGNCQPDGTGCECPMPESPIIIDLDGDGLDLTGPAEGVDFTLVPNQLRRWGWPRSGRDAFLVRDDNGNGVVDDGTEMFGNLSPQTPSSEPNGFRALRWYDVPERGGNSDGVLNAEDAAWSTLMVWSDADHDGVSIGELAPIDSTGIIGFDVVNVIGPIRRVDENGNDYRFSAVVFTRPSSPVPGYVSDIWLPVQDVASDDASGWVECTAWVYAINRDVFNRGEGLDMCDNNAVNEHDNDSNNMLDGVHWDFNGVRWLGEVRRVVSKATAAASSRQWAIDRASQVLEQLVLFDSGNPGQMCMRLPYPHHTEELEDVPASPPYDAYGDFGPPFRYRVKCVPTRSPGGGCGLR